MEVDSLVAPLIVYTSYILLVSLIGTGTGTGVGTGMFGNSPNSMDSSSILFILFTGGTGIAAGTATGVVTGTGTGIGVAHPTGGLFNTQSKSNPVL